MPEIEYGSDGLPASITVWPPSQIDKTRDGIAASKRAIGQMSPADIREATASQMTCPCGEPLALVSAGAVCPNLECAGPRTRRIVLFGIALNKSLYRAWPDRVVSHDKPHRSRLKQFGEGLKKLGADNNRRLKRGHKNETEKESG